MQFSRYIDAMTERTSFSRFASLVDFLEVSGDNEIRTRDLLLARQALSQLSYTPKGFLLYLKDGLKWTRTTDLTLIRRAL